MRPRMYGSSESQRFFTSTSPSFGAGMGSDSRRKSSGLTQPCGRLARTMALFMGKPLRGNSVGIAMVAQTARTEPALRRASVLWFAPVGPGPKRFALFEKRPDAFARLRAGAGFGKHGGGFQAQLRRNRRLADVP